MNLDEMLCNVTTTRPIGTVDFHAYSKAHPTQSKTIRGLAANTAPSLITGVVSLDEVFCSVLSWCIDAIYNFGPPDDLRIMPLQEDLHDFFGEASRISGP